MTRQTSDEAFFKERGFGLKMGFGERPALLVIDLIKAFTDPDRMLRFWFPRAPSTGSRADGVN